MNTKDNKIRAFFEKNKDTAIYVLSVSIIFAALMISNALKNQPTQTCFGKAYQALSKKYTKMEKDALVVAAKSLCR
jgi:hypothetical protein